MGTILWADINAAALKNFFGFNDLMFFYLRVDFYLRFCKQANITTRLIINFREFFFRQKTSKILEYT